MDSFGIANIQSGFVLAVIVLAVFAAERLGGAEELARRMFQVALGVALLFLVISSTAAFLRGPQVPASLQQGAFGGSSSSSNTKEEVSYVKAVARRNAEATTIHGGLGLIFIAAGLVALRRWKTVSIGGALGGLLLLFFGGVQGSTSSGSLLGLLSAYSTVLGTVLGAGGEARDMAHFSVLLVGTAALAALGFWRWERGAASTPAT